MRLKFLLSIMLSTLLHPAFAQTAASYKSADIPLSKDLLAFWDFNEGKGSLLTDYSGSNQHGRIIGLPASGWVLGNGKTPGEGTDRGIDLAYANRSVLFPKLSAQAKAFTLSIWVMPGYVDNGSGEQLILHSKNNLGPVLTMQDNGTLVFSVNNSSNAKLTAAQKLKAYQWQHVAVTVDGREICFYMDGKLAGKKKVAGDVSVSLDSTFGIGKRESDAVAGFDGNIDDLLLYTRALSTAEIGLITKGQLPQRATVSLTAEEEKRKTASPQKTARTPLRKLEGLDEAHFPANPLEKEGYVLTAHDEFNGPKLNEELWIPYYIRQRVSDKAALAEYEFRDGSIVLKITKDKENYNDKGMRVSSLQTLENNDLHKPGGRTDIPTQKKFMQQYGYFEIRAKTQAGSGHCSSFWLLGEGGMRVNRHLTGEVDVIEQPGNLGPNSVAYNLYDWSDSTIGTRITNMGWQNRLRLNKDLTKTFNIYGCEWTPTEIKFYFNNQLINTIPNSIHYPMGVFLSLYEGNDWFGTLSGEQSFPKEFVIDYFRAYQKK